MSVFPGCLQERGDMLFLGEPIQIPALLSPFVAKHNFVPNRFVAQEYQVRAKVEASDVKIVRFDGQFADSFLDLIEEEMEAVVLESAVLRYGVLDSEIIDYVGGNVLTPLHAVFWLLLKQPNCREEGFLQMRGGDNIFFCRNRFGITEAVIIRTVIGGWEVRSEPSDQKWQYRGGQVFFRTCAR